MIAEGVSTIEPIDWSNPPSEGLSVDVVTGKMSYRLDAEGATITLTKDHALQVAWLLLQYAERTDAEVVSLEEYRQ
jgi:hypothetical protein